MKAADFWHITDNLPFPLNQGSEYCSHFFFWPSLLLFFFIQLICWRSQVIGPCRMSTFGCLLLYVSFNLVLYSYKVVFTSSGLSRFRFNILGMDAVYLAPLHQKAPIWLSNFCSTVIFWQEQTSIPILCLKL